MISQAYYGSVAAEICERALDRLDEPLRLILDDFETRFPHPAAPSIPTELETVASFLDDRPPKPAVEAGKQAYSR